MMSTRLAGLLRKETIQFFRDHWVLGLILWLYTIEVVLCTYALSFDVEHVPTTVVDQDRTVASRQLTQAFALSDAFDVVTTQQTPDQAAGRLASGQAGMVVVIPSGFAQAYRSGIHPTVQLLLDGTNSSTAARVRNYALEIVHRFEARHAQLAARPAQVTATPAPRIWYNPDQTTTAFMTLSMIALAGMMVGVIHPAASIVREKEQGTIEQLLVTPIRTGELFAAKTVPTLLMGVLSLFPSLLIVAWFEVPLRGSLLLFIPLTAVFLLSAIALGVLIASVCRTLQQALLLAFFGLFPIMFLSGTLTPVESMPGFLQTLSLGSPLRYYMDIILGVFLKGAGWSELWPQSLVLAAIGAVLFGLSLLVFRRRIG
jgi:ABC-2 type transport system permease protein